MTPAGRSRAASAWSIEAGRWARRLLAVGLLLASSVGPAGGVQVQRLGRGDGLPSTQVHSVAEGPEGFLWFAGPNGLARYDGGRLVVFGRKDGLTTQGLRALLLDPDGRLWVGTDVGVDRLEAGGRFQAVVPRSEWTFGFVEDLAADAGGRVWIATSGGLLSWTAGEGLVPAADPRLMGGLVAAVATQGETVWAAAVDGGLLRHRGGRWEAPEAAGWSEVGRVRTLGAGGDGTLLVGGERGLVEVGENGAAVRRLAGEGADRPVSAALVLLDELWLGIGGQLRLYRLEEGEWRLEEVVLPTALVNRLVADSQGNLWAATDNRGVAKVSILHRALTRIDSPCEAQIFSLTRAANGDYLVGGDLCSFRLRGDDWSLVRRFTGLDGVKVWDLTEDRRGNLWAATERGLYRGAGGDADAMRPVEARGAPVGMRGRVLLERPGEMWLGAVTGLVAVGDEEAVEKTDPDGASLGYVYTLERGPGGEAWIGTLGNGLWRETTDGGFERVLGPGLTARGHVYAVAFGPDGEVAVVQDDRLLVGRGDEWRAMEPAVESEVAGWAALFDDQGSLWVGGNHGLARYDADLGVSLLRLTESMGLTGSEFTTSRSLARDPQGRLLCGLDGGLTVVDPEALVGLDTLPRMKLVSLAWLGAEPRGRGEETVITSGRWTLEAFAFAPWFVDEKSLLYRHRLQGFDPSWTTPRAASAYRIRYTALPAGEYRVEAQAFSPLLGWGPGTELFAFQVLPPWWWQPWAILLWAALLAGVGYFGWWGRNRVLTQRTRQLEALVTERTEELQRALRRVELLAVQDELTGLVNQRGFWEQARRSAAESRRWGTPLALVVFDLDDFKRINDLWGHPVGDTVLAFVAQRMRGALREEDLVARYGGEEFVVLLSHGGEEVMVKTVERLHRELQAQPCEPAPGVPPLTVTASFGLSFWQGPRDSVEELFRRADTAAYAAKRGKNRVVVWSDDLEPAARRPEDLAPKQ